MTEDDFKKIFKWAYGDSFYHNGFEYYIYGSPVGGSASYILSLDTDKHIRQLENKLIMDLKTEYNANLLQIDVSVYNDKHVTRYIVFHPEWKVSIHECAGKGITRDESILNAILDYIDGNFIEKRMKLDSE